MHRLNRMRATRPPTIEGPVERRLQPPREAFSRRLLTTLLAGMAVSWWAAAASCGSAAAAGSPSATPAAPGGLPELTRTKHRAFAIPYRIPKSEDPDPDAVPQRVILEVSKDLGASWQQAGEAGPTATSISYQSDVDGEYWFRLRAVDRKGRSRGGEGPDVRVLVDAAGPRLAARVWKGDDGEIVCRYAAADDSLRPESLRVEYRGAGDKGWKTVAAQGILARESPAHLVGEEIWWAGEKVDSLAVRIAVTDGSGNQTVRQFTLEAADPGVDQSALARELGLPPLPEQSATTSLAATDPGAPDTVTAAPTAAASPTTGPSKAWAAERAGAWSDGQPQGSEQPATGGEPTTRAGRSVLVRPTTAASALLPRGAARPPEAAAADAATSGTAAPGEGLEYRGRPLHVTKSRRVAWDYEVPAVRAASGPLRAELWTTRDGGVTWQQLAVDPDGRSPIDVQLPAPGLYGVRLELVVDATDEGGPRSGAAPEAWVGVDEDAPEVDLVGVTRDEHAAPATLVIRYATRDPLIAARSVRLLYSPHREGPWATIVDAVENQGEYRWEPGRNVPARVYVRVEATDVAGNVGVATCPEPVSITAPRFGGKLGGLRPLPSDAP